MQDCIYILQMRKPWAELPPLSPAEGSRILIYSILIYTCVCVCVCVYTYIYIERERERKHVRTVFVPVHRIQELIQVAKNSEINAIIAILIKRSYRESALRSVRYSCCRSTANSCISLVLT